MTLRYGWWDALGIRSIALWARRDPSTLLRTSPGHTCGVPTQRGRVRHGLLTGISFGAGRSDEKLTQENAKTSLPRFIEHKTAIRSNSALRAELLARARDVRLP